MLWCRPCAEHEAGSLPPCEWRHGDLAINNEGETYKVLDSSMTLYGMATNSPCWWEDLILLKHGTTEASHGTASLYKRVTDVSKQKEYKEHPLGEEVEEELAKAFMTYQETLKEIFSKISSEDLMKFSNEISTEVFKSSLSLLKTHEHSAAQWVLMTRDLVVRSQKALDQGSAYCVNHDCDIKECHLNKRECCDE